MTAANGRANGGAHPRSTGADHSALGIASLQTQTAQQFSPQEIKELVAELEIPFEPSVIEWRVTNTAQGQSRGQVIPIRGSARLYRPAQWHVQSGWLDPQVRCLHQRQL